MIALLGALLAAAGSAPWLYRAAPRHAAAWLALVPLTACCVIAIPGAVPEVEVVSWAPSLGLDLAFRTDGLARLMGVLITGVGALVLVYTGAYLAGHPRQGRMLAYLLLFMASMVGIAAADNLLLLFVCWELTSVSSFLLIGFEHERAEARAAALQALLVTGAGGLALLAGVVLLAQAGGSFSISALAAQPHVVQGSPAYLAVLLLVLAAAFTKSAQVPFHFWLPNAMEAPTPVSAYLHSSTMVKAGVLLLARMHPVLGDTPVWIAIVSATGALTATTGAWMAYRQTDLKRILAYSTVSALGLITLLLGIGGDVALRAALLLLLAHALYKGALFLVAGAMAHATHERDLTRLSGLRRAMPLTAVAAGAAILSMAGVPPLGGFLAKELMLEAVVRQPALAVLLAAFVVAGSTLLAAVAFVVWAGAFMGAPRGAAGAHDGSPALTLPALVLAAAGVCAGLAPAWFAAPLVDPAAASIGVQTPFEALRLWHGVTPALLMSALSLGGGLLLALWWRAPARDAARPDVPGPEAAYQASMRGLLALAGAQTRLLQSGYLRQYLGVTIAVTVVLVAGTMALFLESLPQVSHVAPPVYEVVLLALILASAGVAVRTRSRLGGVAALGVIGYAVALIYLNFGAPDLAMTQFAIETLTVMLFLLALRALPAGRFQPARGQRMRSAAVALSAGALMALLVLLAASAPHADPVSGYFVDRALPDAHGRNVVNVILVDFRALDTLGEITVLGVAGAGVFALLRLRPAAAGGRR